MAHNARIRTPGTWTGAWFAAELLGLDSYLEQAVNGDDGGVWGPSGAIVIGGSGLSVTGPTVFGQLDTLTMSSGTFTVAGTLQVNGGMTLPSTGRLILQSGATTTVDVGFTVASSGLVTFTATSALAFPVLLGGTPSTWTGAPAFASSFSGTMSGIVSFADHAQFTTANTLSQGSSGAATISCPVTFSSGSITQSCARTLSGASAGIGWRRLIASNGASTYDVSGDSYTVPNLSASHNYTLASSGAGGTMVPTTGMRLHFHGRVGTFGPQFIREGGALIFPSPMTVPWWADFYFDGTAWQIENYANGAQGFSNLS